VELVRQLISYLASYLVRQSVSYLVISRSVVMAVGSCSATFYFFISLPWCLFVKILLHQYWNFFKHMSLIFKYFSCVKWAPVTRASGVLGLRMKEMASRYGG